MTGGSESQQEAVAVRRGVLSIGFWNVGTIFSTRILVQITRKMNENSLHILGISECRRTGFSSRKTGGGETILFSGQNDNPHR